MFFSLRAKIVPFFWAKTLDFNNKNFNSCAIILHVCAVIGVACIMKIKLTKRVLLKKTKAWPLQSIPLYGICLYGEFPVDIKSNVHN